MNNRFETNNSIIIDTETKLMWMQKPLEGSYNFDQACAIKHSFGGFDDWRLPTIEELTGIIDYKKSHPACNEVFRFGKGQIFWSSSPNVGSIFIAWNVNFNYGYVNNNNRNNALPVRLVRG